jgi:energy-coupling factor transporter transmembrane protein EcfT
MKTLKISYSTFVTFFTLPIIFIVFFLVVLIFCIFIYGFQILVLVWLLPTLVPIFYLLLIINYYLYDKNTIIEIDEKGNISYSNLMQKHFHIQDIDLCTELRSSGFAIGYTEIYLKDGSCIYVSNLISLQPIYEINPKIKRENFGFWPKILRRENMII